MKVCHVFELKTPTKMQIFRIIQTIPQIAEKATEEEKQKIVEYSQGDLRKCFSVTKYADISSWLTTFRLKTFNEDSKIITKRLLHNKVRIEDHNVTINETERTIIALLWHENVVDYINRSPSTALSKIQLYHKILKNICFADYIDRITFQNQIWQFNEMSSLIKTMYNNKIYHETMAITNSCNDLETLTKQEIRFTKILTKYSTEYNNANFVYSLCNKMDMDRKDVICFFQEMRILKSLSKNDLVQQEMLNRAEITNLDVKRFYRYLDQNDKREESSMIEEEIMENEENMEEISCYDFI
jgi:DNA polymerase III delta prime subunit